MYCVQVLLGGSKAPSKCDSTQKGVHVPLRHAGESRNPETFLGFRVKPGMTTALSATLFRGAVLIISWSACDGQFILSISLNHQQGHVIVLCSPGLEPIHHLEDMVAQFSTSQSPGSGDHLTQPPRSKELTRG